MKKKPSLFGISKTTRVGTYTVVLSLIALAICVVVNLLFGLLPARATQWNVSSYPFSATTKKLMNSLESDVHITYVFYNTEDQTTQEDLVYPILTRYSHLSEHVTFSSVNPVANPDYLEAYGTTYETNNIYLVFEGRGRYRVLSGDTFFDYVFPNYGTFTQAEFYEIYQSAYTQYVQNNGSVTENTVEYALMTGSYSVNIHAEDDFNQALAYVSAETAPMTYLISPGGTLNTVFATYLEGKGYTYQALTLDENGSIPENAQCLLVCLPEEDFTDAQTLSIKQFLENGGKMVLCTESTNLDMKNLMTLAADYGLTPGKGEVVVTSAATSTTEASESKYENSHYIQIASPLPDGVTSNPFMVTGQDSTSVVIDNISTKTGALTMGVSVAKEQANGLTTQIVWYSSHEILEAAASYAAMADQYAGTSYSAYGTYIFIEDALACMNADDLVTGVDARPITDVSTYLDVTEYDSEYQIVSKGSVYFWQVALCALIPLLLIAGAVLTWFVRSRK